MRRRFGSQGRTGPRTTWWCLAAWGVMCVVQAVALPPNLALQATATANSEYSGQYLARFAIDGKIPAAGGQSDSGEAWCVQGATHRHGAEFTLEWREPVTVAELVYWGRTAWLAEDSWKDYEVWLDSAETPVMQGRFELGHGPQRIRLPEPVSVCKVLLRFASSHGGPNPGASEIQVFGASPSAAALAKFRRLSPGRPEPGEESIEDSEALRAELMSGRLGFDRLVVVRRQELNPSHVYTYHVEGFGPGGGLYVLDAVGLARAAVDGLEEPEAAARADPGLRCEL